SSLATPASRVRQPRRTRTSAPWIGPPGIGRTTTSPGTSSRPSPIATGTGCSRSSWARASRARSTRKGKRSRFHHPLMLLAMASVEPRGEQNEWLPRRKKSHSKTNDVENLMLIKNRLKRSFTLVQLMIVVAIVGVLAALAIYGVRKYIANAKTAEARNSIGQIAKDAAAAYAREGMAGDVLEQGETAALSNALCASADATVPSSIDDVK